MLRITTQEGPTAITLVLEGKCRGPWVEELERCWRKAAALASGRTLRVDLEKVGFADERGKELLAEMYAAGVELDAVGLMMASLVEEIVASSSKRRNNAPSSIGWGIFVRTTTGLRSIEWGEFLRRFDRVDSASITTCGRSATVP